VVAFPIFYYIYVVGNRQNQTLHDKVVSSVVVATDQSDGGASG
jgi:hypothetical protein